jgi:release factor glutamine methyltransferase
VAGCLERLASALAAAGVAEPRTAARDVVAALLDVPRLWPLTNGGAPVAPASWAAAERAVTLLAAGAPFAYAVGRASFRHLTLAVDERVLIPRPETELLVDEVLARVAPGGTAVDVGTGSGAIALALASEGRFARVVATDVSLDALAVARQNAAALAPTLRAPVELRHGSLLAPVVGERARVVVSNPPYIAHEEAAELPAAVRDWEPPLALFSPSHGLAATATLVAQAAAVLEPDGLLALEVDTRRAALVAELVGGDGRYHDVVVRPDLTGRERFVIARRG